MNKEVILGALLDIERIFYKNSKSLHRRVEDNVAGELLAARVRRECLQSIVLPTLLCSLIEDGLLSKLTSNVY